MQNVQPFWLCSPVQWAGGNNAEMDGVQSHEKPCVNTVIPTPSPSQGH